MSETTEDGEATRGNDDLTAKAVAPLKVRMNPAEQEALIARLEKSSFYLEYGCGGSTELALTKRRGPVVSIESDPEWIQNLKARPVISDAIQENRLNLVHIDLGPVGPWGRPRNMARAAEWHHYYTHPFTAFDFNYDFILIDGRFRMMCAYTAYVCASNDVTVAIHDYHNRVEYFEVEKFFDIEYSVDTLYFFKKRTRVNPKSLYLSSVSNALRP